MKSLQLPDINQYVTTATSKKEIDPKIRQELEKFKKMGTHKSIDKFIKSSDLSYVIGKDSNYYPKQLEDFKRINEVDEVHNNLNQLKRSCDDMKRKAQLKEKEIEQMRKEIDQMTKKEEDFTQSQEQLANQSQQLEAQFTETKQKQLDALMTKKTYEHMLSRMKKDRLIHQLRANTFEDLLNMNQTALQSKTQESKRILLDSQLTSQALQDIIEGKEQQNLNRELNLQRFKDFLMNKQEIEQKREDRIKRQNEIAEIAANEIRDSNLKKWRKLLLVHKFLNQFLKLKMQREIKKYQGAEQAFQKIKAATGVNDANEIVKKFLGREQTYSHLLISIAEYEKKIDQMKHENEELNQSLSKLKEEFGIVEKETARDSIGNSKQEKILAEVDEKATISNLLMNKLNQWIEKNLFKLHRANLTEEKSAEPLKEGFYQIVQVVRQQLLSLPAEEQASLLDQQIQFQKDEIYEPEFQRRNVRVKPSQFPKPLNTSHSQEHPHSSKGDEDDYEQEFDNDLSRVSEQNFNPEHEQEHIKELRDELRIKRKK